MKHSWLSTEVKSVVTETDAHVGLLVRFARSRWWIVGSTVVPVALTAITVLYGASRLAREQAGLRQELEVRRQVTMEAERKRDNAEKAEVKANAAAAAAAAQIEELKKQTAELQAQRDALELATATPSASKIIQEVHSTMANRTPRERAKALFDAADVANRKSHPEVAYPVYEASAQEDGTYYQPLIALGYMELNRRDWKGAKQRYLAAREADPTSPYPLIALVTVLVYENNLEDAEKYANILREMTNRPPGAYDALARLEQAEQKTRKNPQ